MGNQIRYDRLSWPTYTTDHFEIYYYPEIGPLLERIAGYAESAYQHVSTELKHDLAFKVPLILFASSSELWQQNVIPGQRRKVWMPSQNRAATASSCPWMSRRIYCTGWSPMN